MKYPQLVSMPSAVSDWLEEQLEARGIDAVVYTRYVLSLLYRDPADIICPEQDLHITHPNKEVVKRAAGGGRKRFRRSDYWGGGQHAAFHTADQLKRSAAVECLMSASDQKCGIESLVDELCEKLKKIQSDSTNPTIEPISTTTKPSKKLTAQDSAKRYYAAFPALTNNNNHTTTTAATTSPNIITLIPKWFGSPKKKRQNHRSSSSYEDKLHFKVESEHNMMKATNKRINYFTRNRSNVIECPDSLYTFNNNRNNALANEMDEDVDFNDLPVDLRDLLDSPIAQSDSFQTIANMRPIKQQKPFINCGTNIISSIWSNDASMDDTLYDNRFNAQLDSQFNSISIDNENDTNSFYENYSVLNCERFGLGQFELDQFELDQLELNQCEPFEKWSDQDNYANDEVIKSLIKLNHNKEASCFIEVKQKPFNVFANNSKVIGDVDEVVDALDEVDKEDLLHSISSHFKPINEQLNEPNQAGKGYADGTTFIIPNSLEKVKFTRSESGIMYLNDSLKRYFEYKHLDTNDFTLKFNINQNDKSCQTDLGNDLGGFYFPGDDDLLLDGCNCVDAADSLIKSRPDSVMAEIFGKNECEQCNWANNNIKGVTNENIWSGGDLCMACLALNRCNKLMSQERIQLRQDITQDGEQLLNDLSCLQQTYMDELPIACLGEVITKTIEEPVPIHSASSFSFTTRLQQDCLLKMATMPTLRSVTL